MSKLSEYIALIPKGIKNADKFISGVINDVKLEYRLLPSDQQEEIIRRRLICSTCPFMSKNAEYSKEYKELHGESYITDRQDNHCTFCGCPLAYRTASLDMPCGIQDWNDEHSDSPLPLKWNIYDNT